MKLIERRRSAHPLRSVGDQLERIHPNESTWLANDPCLLALKVAPAGQGWATSVAGRIPAEAFAARVKAGPVAELASIQYRVRHDRIDETGTVTLRYRSRLQHVRVGAAHRNKCYGLCS